MRRAAELRQAFDHSFTEAPPDSAAPTTALLTIGVAGDSYALRLAEIAGLYADKKITPLPTESADLLGLTGFRGALIPVYDLRSLLGYSAITTTTAITVPRWQVLLASKTPLALAFERFDGYVGIAPELVARDTPGVGKRLHVVETALTADGLRPIVNVGSILDSIKQRAQTIVAQREQ